jgi:ABC-type uncharacterized transport system ATPase subunit
MRNAHLLMQNVTFKQPNKISFFPRNKGTNRKWKRNSNLKLAQSFSGCRWDLASSLSLNILKLWLKTNKIEQSSSFLLVWKKLCLLNKQKMFLMKNVIHLSSGNVFFCRVIIIFVNPFVNGEISFFVTSVSLQRKSHL